MPAIGINTKTTAVLIPTAAIPIDKMREANHLHSGRLWFIPLNKWKSEPNEPISSPFSYWLSRI